MFQTKTPPQELQPATDQRTVEQLRPAAAQRQKGADVLASEVPVALQYNGINHVVMLASGIDLIDLAYGFSFTEGIIRQSSDIYDCEVLDTDQGYVLDITIASACLQQLKKKRRRLTGQTGCGLCGIESLAAIEHPMQPLPDGPSPLEAQAVQTALTQLSQQQPLRALTGATHAAGWADFSGQVLCVREDVGRHNALDKLIGQLQRQAVKPDSGFVVVSSRASYEMVQKTITASIPALVAVSAPTSMAVEVAQNNNLILVGFARQNTFNIYNGQVLFNR